MKIRSWGHCKELLDEAIGTTMGDYSAWLDSNPGVNVLMMDTALSEVNYLCDGEMLDYYTYVLTIGYKDAEPELDQCGDCGYCASPAPYRCSYGRCEGPICADHRNPQGLCPDCERDRR